MSGAYEILLFVARQGDHLVRPVVGATFEELLRQPDLDDLGAQLQVHSFRRPDDHHPLPLVQSHRGMLRIGGDLHVPGDAQLPYGDSLLRQRL